MSGKKKLLIAMGCSMTEGVGCYDINIIPKECTRENGLFFSKQYAHIYNKSRDRFHQNSWPSVLGKKLNYHKVLNLGLAGSSTSGQFKVFLDKYEDEIFEEYDVVLMWFLTEPSRLSYYRGGIVTNTITSRIKTNGKFERGYIESIEDIIVDPLLEQLTYVKAMAEICNNRKWEYIVMHYDNQFEYYIKKLNQKPYWLFGTWYRNLDGNLSPVCTHPNEKGYELIAGEMFDEIMKVKPHIFNKGEKVETELEYNGHSKKYDIKKLHPIRNII